jgi:putative transferase (TIGR04331 family)
LAVHLITTALHGDPPAGSRVVLLGTWARAYIRGRRADAAASLVPYHWDDRSKLSRDYDDLKELHGRLLVALTEELNGLHAIRRDVRYWQMLLDLWLVDYLGTMFDRWETLRVAMTAHETVVTDRIVRDERRPPFGWFDFIAAATADEWNHNVYLDILAHAYANRCEIRDRMRRTVPAGASDPSGTGQANASPRGGARLRRAIVDAWARAERLLCDRNPVFFHSTLMPPFAFAAINLSLGQWPRFRSPFGFAGRDDRLAPARRRLLNGFAARNDFERWLIGRIGAELPASAVESFEALRAHALGLRARCKVIFTTNGQYTDESFKVWAAEKIHDGCRFVVSEHGGSFPAPKELFDYEEDVCDARVTWFAPYHPKHVQLPATKLAGRVRCVRPGARRAGDTCAVIAPDYPRYAYRAHFYPVAGQVQAVHDMIADLHAQVSAPVREAFRVKPYPAMNAYRNAVDWFEDRLGSAAVIRNQSLSDVFHRARIVVCMYPETAFAEAMATGVPLILVYPPQYYERHPAAEPLIATMKAAGIVFHDAAAAADHLCEVWDDPSAWWERADVMRAREAFRGHALGHRGSWLREWVSFFLKTAAAAPATRSALA